MPNQIDAFGIQTATRDEALAGLKLGFPGFPGFYAIYGADANLDPNTADGNFLNLIAQMAADYGEFLGDVYAQFDPDQAIGVNLDRACAYNGVVRKGGTRSTQLVAVTVNQALTLQGFDTFPDAPFTISDASGNQFRLVATYAFGGAGTQNLTFEAVLIGAVQVAANSLTNIVTVTAGVTGVNNGVLAGTTGTNEESDFALRVRRQQSVQVPSKGYLQGLIGALLAIDSVTSAVVLENDTNTTDGNMIPGHSIWAIVAGGTNDEVANAIYVKRNAGCGMKGGVSVNVTQVDGTVFQVLFDRPIAENLWLKLDIAAITGSAPTAATLRAQILAGITYAINQQADFSTVVAFVKGLYPNCSVSGDGVSPDDVTYADLLAPTGPQYQFALATARISINGTHG